jgi:hypothetical protein
MKLGRRKKRGEMLKGLVKEESTCEDLWKS